MGMSFLLLFFVVLGDGIQSIVDSALSREESGRVLIWDFSLTVTYQFRAGSACGLLLDT